MKPSPERLSNLDALRGLAALWVLLFHFMLSQQMPSLALVAPWLAEQVFAQGHLGVSVFFVLSGLVMAITMSPVAMSLHNAVRFVGRRLARLSPPYYVTVAVGVALLAIKVAFGDNRVSVPSLASIAAHLVYAQDWLGFDNIIDVFWTLTVEVQFYLAFALLWWLADTTSGNAPSTTARDRWALGVAVLALLWPLKVLPGPLWPGGFLPLWYMFMAGVLCAGALQGRPGQSVVALAYAAVLLAMGAALRDGSSLVAGCTVVFIVLLSRGPAVTRWLSHPWLQTLGLVSYSFYLIHLSVMGPTMRVFRKVWAGGVASDIVGLLVVMAASLGVALLMHRTLERPSIALSRRITYA